jgi:hypothetical protein
VRIKTYSPTFQKEFDLWFMVKNYNIGLREEYNSHEQQASPS